MNTHKIYKYTIKGACGAYSASSKCFGFYEPKCSTGKGFDSININYVKTQSIATAESITKRVVDGKLVLAMWEALCGCMQSALLSVRTTTHGTL